MTVKRHGGAIGPATTWNTRLWELPKEGLNDSEEWMEGGRGEQEDERRGEMGNWDCYVK